MRSGDECKKILSKLGFEFGISPNLITARLLSDEDKLDLRSGLVEISALRCHIGAFRDAGLPDVAHGSLEPLHLVGTKLVNS